MSLLHARPFRVRQPSRQGIFAFSRGAIPAWVAALIIASTATGQAPDSNLTAARYASGVVTTLTDPYSVRNDHAFVRQVFGTSDSSRFQAGVEAYLRLITSGGITDADRSIVLRHLEHSIDVMPREHRPGHKSRESGDGLNDSNLDSIGVEVARWWRSQDPFPITERNERLEEHLSRWGYAIEEFTNDQEERGYDDRGAIYIRFGPPGKFVTIRTDESRRAYGISNSLVFTDFPDSEMWVYRHVHDEAYYFFARDSRRSGYRLAHPSETIPARLSAGLDHRHPRGQQKADFLLLLMEEVYAQLALAHPIFGSTYDEVVRFRLSTHTALEPDMFARSALANASTIEVESAGRRNDLVPASFSDTKGLTEDLPLYTRWARFLEPDGTTRTEIYWSLESERLEPSRRLERRLTDQGHTPSDRYLIAVTVAQQTPDFMRRDVQTRHYLVDSTLAATLRAQIFTVRGDTSRYNVVAQWSQHWTKETEEGQLGEGAMLKLATVQLDTLSALNRTGRHLEMSDLKPVFAANPDVPYPFERLNPVAPPELYFELYNLHYGPEDETQYTIEYEVTGASDGSGDLTAMPTRARTTYSGSERVAREQIGLDLDQWRQGGAVQITVRATDEITSEQVERSISFELTP